MTRFLRALCVVALIVALVEAAPRADAAEPGTRLLGFSAHLLANADRATYLGHAAGTGARTIRDDISWASVESRPGVYDWSGPDEIVTQAANRGMAVLLLVDSTPAWARVAPGPNPGNAWWLPPANPADYGNFAAQVAARYGADGTFWSSHPTVPRVLPAGIEIWNEPNLSLFWGGLPPDPARYAAMLADAYPKIKQVDPTMPVISAGLAPAGGWNDVDCNGTADTGASATKMNGLNFLAAMYAGGARGNLDAVGWHPYNFWNGATAIQALSYHLCSAWSQMAETPTSVRSLMGANGDGAKPVWATEIGAPTCIANATYPCMTEPEQGALASFALRQWQSSAWAGNFYWYDLRDDNGGTSTADGEQHFGVVRADNTPKPAYGVLRDAFNAASGSTTTTTGATTTSTTAATTTSLGPPTTPPPSTTPTTIQPAPTTTQPAPTTTPTVAPTTAVVARPVASPVPSGPSASGNDIVPGEVLTVGQVLRSARGGRYTLVYQGDGNLVAYDRGTAYWSTKTWDHTTGAVAFRPDGSVALFDAAGTVLWSTPATATPGRLVLLRNGVIALYRTDGSVAWTGGARRSR